MRGRWGEMVSGARRLSMAVLMASALAFAGTAAARDLGGCRFAQAQAQGWNDLSPEERGEALRNYQRFQQLRPDQREDVERNYDRWQQMPPQEKERIRGNYQRYRELSPDERRQFQHQFQRWKQNR